MFPPSVRVVYAPGMDVASWCCQALLQLPLANFALAVYLLSFVREVMCCSDSVLSLLSQYLKHSAENGASVDDVSSVLAAALFQVPSTSTLPCNSAVRRPLRSVR